MPWDQIYSAVIPGRSFNMFFNQANVLRGAEEPRRAGGSLMIYASGELGRRTLEKGDARIRDDFLSDLHAVFPDTRGIIGEISLRRWEYATAYAHVGRAALQPALERPLGKVFLAGDYLGAWFTDSAILTGAQAAAGAERLLSSTESASAAARAALARARALPDASSSSSDKGTHA
jgi:oxygen-dependent protoporphyrinogen oxidase